MPRSPRLAAACPPACGDSSSSRVTNAASDQKPSKEPTLDRADVLQRRPKRLKRKKVRKAFAAIGSVDSFGKSPTEDIAKKKKRMKKDKNLLPQLVPVKQLANCTAAAVTTEASDDQPTVLKCGALPHKQKRVTRGSAPGSKNITIDDFPTKKEWRRKVKLLQAPPMGNEAFQKEGHNETAVNDSTMVSKTTSSAETPKTCGAKRKARTETETCAAIPKMARGIDGSGIKATVVGTTAFRQTHSIVVTGTCPAPFETFECMQNHIDERIIEAMRLQGYTAPTPIQAQAWPIALRGQDMVAVAKTGSGKTLGFMLPALACLCQCRSSVAPKTGEPSYPKVLVLAPTRELAQQIAGEAQKFAVVPKARVVAIYGGVPKNDQVRELELGADVVIATPGRLLDFAAGRPEKGQGPLVSLKLVSYLVLDEADRMLDMGFEPEIRKIIADCPKSGRPEDTLMLAHANPARQTLFFTATWPATVQQAARSLTGSGAVQIRIGQGAGGDKLTANTDVTQNVIVIEEKQKLTRLHEILAKELHSGESAFVFAKTRHTCDYLEKKLWDEKEDLSIGTWCRAMHSHKDQWDRDASLATFRNITLGKDNGRRGILVATDVAARGLDIPGVALVIVYDFGGGNLGQDSGVESYVHRIGRTGRAGKLGKAFTFFTAHDSGAAKLVKLLDGAKQRVPYELRALAEKGGGCKGGKSGKGKGWKSSKGSKTWTGGKGKGNAGKGGKGKYRG